MDNIPLQSSMAVATPVLAGVVFPVQSLVAFGGQVTTGPWVSVTVIVCTHVPVLPQLSVAVQVLRML